MRRGPSLPAAALCAALGAALAGPARAAPAVYVLDPDHCFVHFEVLHFNTSTLRGRFGPVSGAVEMDRAAGRGRLALTIDVGSLDTGLRLLDKRLLAPDLLAAELHPQAYFVAERFRFDGAGLAEVRGEFTLRGVGQALSLVAERFACRPDTERGGEVCGGDFVGELSRSAFGASFGLPFVGDRVRLRVQAEGHRR